MSQLLLEQVGCSESTPARAEILLYSAFLFVIVILYVQSSFHMSSRDLEHLFSY